MERGKAQTARELQKTLQSVTTRTIYSGVTGICGAGEENRCGGWQWAVQREEWFGACHLSLGLILDLDFRAITLPFQYF